VVDDGDLSRGHAGHDHDHAHGDAGEVDCREAIHTLYHFLDGELTEYRRVEIRQHLEGCMDCLEAYDFEAELKIVIARKCRDEVPPSLRERIAKALQHEAGDPGISQF
jgi:mycothiol system anti-sigma-R factor